jgi:hypothetical protein
LSIPSSFPSSPSPLLSSQQFLLLGPLFICATKNSHRRGQWP